MTVQDLVSVIDYLFLDLILIIIIVMGVESR